MLFLICTILLLPIFVWTDENIYVLNHKPLNVVSDKFLSVSIDPAILLTSINLSNISLQIASHMSPAYVRIAGPSTEFVKYVDTDDKSVEIEHGDVGSVTVTPSVWFAINEWFSMANLTPVFGINDAETVMGVWNPKSILPLLELSDKFNVSCLWQLGYDCSNKTSGQYIEDLRILRHILDAFQDKRDSWKIVGSNIRECANFYDSRRIINDVKGIADVVMWENLDNEIDVSKIRDDLVRPLITVGRNNPKVWTTGKKSHHACTFQSALEWAMEVGEASRQGFNVILRQPRIHEFFVDTPVFWFSLLYKTLAGNIVLDLKSTGTQTNSDVFAYCAKNQNNFIQRGAMTLMVINHDDTECNVHLKMMSLPSNIEVQSYVLTTKSDMRTIYLNNERLRLDMLESGKVVFTPKLRRAKPTNGISFSVPENSIAFFVLPGAKVSTCAEENEEMTLLMEEIKEDQEISFSDEIAVDLKSRLSSRNLSLKEMQKNLEDELEADEKFYHKRRKGKASEKLDDVLENLKDKYDNEEHLDKLQFKLDEETRKIILERARLSQAQKKITESEQRLLDLGKLFRSKSKSLPKSHEETTNNSEEIMSPTNDIDKSEPKSHLLNMPKSRMDKIKDLLAIKPKLKLTPFDFSKNIQHEIHSKLSHHHKTLNDQLKEILDKPKSNFHSKHSSDDKNSDKSSEVELELSSAEVKKVLMDRVKSRAARTNIRFTNEELVNIMKKATTRLKHANILKQRNRRRRDTQSVRIKKDINMKLLNDVTKHQSFGTEKKTRNIYDASQESDEVIPEKPSKSEIFKDSKKVIVSPFSRISNDRKKIKLKHNKDSDLDIEDDFDYFSDKDDHEEPENKRNVPKFKSTTRKLEKFKIPVSLDIGKKKTKDIPELKTRTTDPDEVDDDFKKFTRLDDYFRNAKEFQEKFDDIDFSDESDYGNFDSDEKLTRLKRHDIDKRNTECNCEKHNCNCKIGGKCECCKTEMLQEIMNVVEPFFGNASHDNLQHFFEENSKRYTELADSLSKRLDAENREHQKQKIRRSVPDVDALLNYTPLHECIQEWSPQDVMSLGKQSSASPKSHDSYINDLPLYEHLLHGNMKRSIQDNEISYDSTENRNKNNKIEVGSSLDSLRNKNRTDHKEVFLKQDSQELKKYDNGSKFTLENRLNLGNNSILNITAPVEISVNSKTNKKSSNIQQISKKSKDSMFQKMLHQITTFFGQMGYKIKNYFSDLMK